MPPSSRRSAYDQSFKGIRPLLAGTWRSWCELRGRRRYVATPASLSTPASSLVSRQDGLMRARLSPVCGVDLVPSPTSFPATRPDRPGLGTVSARPEGRTTSHHPTTHHMPPSCRRTWLGSTPKGSPLDPNDPLMRSSCWTTLLPATSGTPWKAQVRLAAAAGLPGAVALELAAGK